METREKLRRIYLFRELSDRQLERIAHIIHGVYFSPGEVIFEEDDEADCCYLINTGCVRVTTYTAKSGEEEIARLGSGSFFGELALLGDHHRMATVTALEPTEAIRLDEEELNLLLAADTDLAMAFYRALAHGLAQRLTKTTGQFSFLKAIVHSQHL